ncbi:MAG: alpha-mannosidase, partial [Candidatus Hydrogenedentes bacterium]|nr:alpha-mannosidase [Candidatus Hydrogenedentota bacterium]
MSDESRSYTLHMIGHGHIDPTWLWRWTEGYEEVRATFRSALDRMKETPEFRFTASSACFYDWVKNADPDMFEEIRQRVAEGRWEIVGGMWIEPDCNLPSGESLVRQGLYGQRFFQREFGKLATVGFNPDTFGHPGNLPQILKGLGLNHYVFMRPWAVEERDYPGGTTFWWEAPDGTQVLASNLGCDYNCLTDTRGWMESLPSTPQLNPGQSHLLGFYGVGNHGGGPTKAAIADIQALQQEDGPLTPVFSTLEGFFEALESDIDATAFPVTTTELQHHARGCYSVHAGIKRWNRQVEHSLLTAERLATMAALLRANPYPKAALSASWKDLLYNHFHDIIAGTSLESSYEDSRDQLGAARHRCKCIINESIQTIARDIDTTPDGNTIVVFNPLPWAVQQPVLASPILRRALEAPLHLVDDKENAVPVQEVNGEALSRMPFAGKRYAFLAEVPALGYRCYHARSQVKSVRSEAPLAATHTSLENQWWRIELDPYGGHITRLLDKKAGVEILKGGLILAVIQDNSDTWSHGVKEYRIEAGRFSQARLQLVEEGDVLATIQIESSFGKSHAVQELTLYRDNPRIDCRLRVNWQEAYHLLKVSFETTIADGIATYETPYAHAVREAHGEAEPGQQWFDLSGTLDSTASGVIILNDGQYSFDSKNNTRRMTLLRSPAYAHHDPVRYSQESRQTLMDQGWHSFHMQILPHTGDWRTAHTPRAAWEHNVPSIPHIESTHPGKRPQVGAMLACDAPNVVLTVLKEQEDGENLVVRGYETDGIPVNTTILFPMMDQESQVEFGAHEVKTLL